MQASDLARSNALALLARHARTKPTAVAFRSKHLGIYRERTWRDYAGLVARAAAGLKRLGVTRGERVAIMGDPCEEWMLADLGAQAVGAISYGIYPTASASEVEYQLRDAGAVGLRRPGPGIRGSHPALRGPSARAALHRGRRHLGHVQLRAPQAPWLERGARRGERRRRRARRAGGARRRHRSPATPPSSSTPRARPATPRAPLVAHGRHLAGAYNLVQHYPVWPSRSAPWSTCRSATCWARRRADAAAALGAGPALRRGRRGPRRRPSSRSRPRCSSRCRAICRSSPRGPWSPCRTSSRPKRLVYDARDAGGPPPRARALGGTRRRSRPPGLRARASCRLPPPAQQAGVRRARARHQRRGAAAAGDDGAVADLGRERLRDLRPDRGGRRHHHRPARALPAPGRRRHAGARVGAEARPRRARSSSAASTCSRATGAMRRRRARCGPRTAGFTPATSANGRTAGSA